MKYLSYYLCIFLCNYTAFTINAQTPTSSPTFATQTISYMSSVQTYSIPGNANLFTVTLYGGNGGDYLSYLGGSGGITTATIYVPAGTTEFYILCGGNDGTNGG